MKKRHVIIFVFAWAIAIPSLLALRQLSRATYSEENRAAAILSHWTRQDALLAHLQRIRELQTPAVKNDSLHAIVNAATSKSLAKGDAAARSNLVRDYLLWVAVPIAESLKENGATESELSDFLLAAWDAFGALAESFEPYDCPQGHRMMAKTAQRDYEDGCMLFDATIIPLLFQGMPDGAAERFRYRWRSKFPAAGGK